MSFFMILISSLYDKAGITDLCKLTIRVCGSICPAEESCPAPEREELACCRNLAWSQAGGRFAEIHGQRKSIIAFLMF